MRLIDVDGLIEFIDMGHLRSPMEICFSERDVVDMLERRTTVDAVPVVRCRECKHMEISTQTNGRYCNVWGFFNGAGDDGFCNYGEREEGADNG